MFFLVLFTKSAEVERSALSFLLNFVCFSKKSQKNDIFLRKKAVFFKKKSCFFVLFSCVRCTARDTELKII